MATATLPNPDDFLTPKQTLELLALHNFCRNMVTLRRWYRSDKFPQPIFSPTGRALYFRKADVFAWIKNHENIEGE